MLVVWGATMLLLFYIRDIGSSVMFFGAFLAMLYLATSRLSFVVIGLVLFVLTGLEVARLIAGRCHVAFITAFDQHALGAFEIGAIDYVLKPLVMARLVTTVQRLKARVSQPPA